MDDPLAHFDSAYPDLVTLDKRSAVDDGARSPDDTGALTDVDKGSTCSTGGLAASKTPAGAPKKRQKVYKPGYNSNKARDERKEALLLLRKQVVELQALRDELQHRQSDCKAVDELPTKQPALRTTLMNRTRQSRASRASSGVWKDVAATQFKDRQRAEIDNIRLRRALEAQLKVSRGLGKVLSKRHNERVLESIGDRHNLMLSANRATDPETDALIFRELLALVVNAVVDVDQDMAANGLDRTVSNHHDAVVHRDSTNSVTLEVYASKVMPFDVASTGDAAWAHYSDSIDRLPLRTVIDKQRQVESTPADTIAESFGLRLESSRKTTATMFVRRVLRKFIEPGRVVIAWRAVSEPAEVATVRVDGSQLIERGFTVVRKAPDGVEEHSLVQTCYIVRPEFSPDELELELGRQVSIVTDFLVDSVTHLISASHQAVENALMDQKLLCSSSVDS